MNPTTELTKTRHLTVLCEEEPRQEYACRQVKPGCGRVFPFSTKRTHSTERSPWMAVCPWCGKKSRMDLRAYMEHESRQAAYASAFEQNQQQEGA